MAVLYIVGTPIGNLEDASPRALRVLQEVALIAAEDTRVTRQLLSHFDIHTPLASFTDAYERNKAARCQQILDALAGDNDVALVSDAGMPGLSDPGYELIQAVLAGGYELIVVPGPSAVTAALLASGLPADRFTFLGFLPRKAAARRAFLAQLAGEPGTLVAFESPHRLPEALADALAVLGDRPIAVARELTKRFEEVWRGRLSEAGQHFREQPRGEITLVIAGAGQSRADAAAWSSAEVGKALELLAQEGLPPAAIARVVARLSGWPRSDVYDLVSARQRS